MLREYFLVQLYEQVSVLLPLDETAEVITLTKREICPIPGVPTALLGVVNQRGRLLWVLDLSHYVGLTAARRWQPQDNLTLIVITSGAANSTLQETRQVGCVVSALKGIIAYDSQNLKQGQKGFYERQGGFFLDSFFSGVAEIDQSPVAVLDVNAVFSNLSENNNSLVSL